MKTPQKNQESNLEYLSTFKSIESELQRNNSLLEKRLSFKRNFLMSVLNGVGSAIGAVLIGSIVAGIIVSNLDKLERVPVVGDLVSPDRIEEIIKEQ